MASGAHSAASPPRSRASRRAARRKRSVTARSPASMASRAMAPVATPCCAASVSRRTRSDTGMLTVRLLASGSAPSGPRRLRGLDRSIVVLTQYTIVTSIARINQALNRSSLVRKSTFYRLTIGCVTIIRSCRAPWKGAVSQRVRIPPGNCRSSRKQSERCKEATNWTEAREAPWVARTRQPGNREDQLGPAG